LSGRALRRWMCGLGAIALAFALAVGGVPEAQAQEKKPNILVIFGDDIGQSNTAPTRTA
jgi:spermidine/putrescine-binding protein